MNSKKFKLIETISNLKYKYRKAMKYQNGDPSLKTNEGIHSNDILIIETNESQTYLYNSESRRVLEEWKSGKIICRSWTFPVEEETEMK